MPSVAPLHSGEDAGPSTDELIKLRRRVAALEGELRSVRERNLSNDEHRLHRLHQLTSDGTLGLEDKIQEVLRLGLETFGMKIAIVSEIEDTVYTVQQSQSLLDPIPVGTSFQLGSTYCFHTLNADHTTSFHHVAHSDIREHPCYQTFALESYIGTVLMVGGKRMGTLNFSSPDPVRPFSERDFTLIELFAQWIGYELEREQNLAALQAARERAETATKARSEFLATVSHELRAPLSGVLNVLGVLGDTTLDSEQSRYLGLLTRSSSMMLTMLNDLLDLAKIEAGQLTLERLPFSFAELVTDVADLMSPVPQQRGVEFRVDNTVTSNRIGDPTRIRQVLLNLVSNAVKFTSEGSITVHAREESDAIRVAVSDTGIGLSDAQRAKLFQPFTQADATISRRFGGTGLGLTVCRQIVEAMGGTIGVDSVEGEGSTFWFRVPLPRAERLESFPPTAGRKILVADDSPVNRFLCSRLLEGVGYVVTAVEDGEKALEAAVDVRFDAVLLDLQMPIVDGYTAAAALRASQGPAMPIISISADMNPDERDHHAASGFDVATPKPFELQRMVDAIERLCARSAP